MSDDNLSKTLIVPNPGGRRKGTETNIPVPKQPGQPQSNQTPPQPSSNAPLALPDSENIILSSCQEILTLASNIKSLEPANSILQLRQDIDRLISQMNDKLTRANQSNEVILTARYIVCCLLDELVLSTPWGSEGVWSQQTLLSQYHNETWGGEKFFLIVNKLLEQPERNINLIELCYVCLSAGFCGKYRIAQNGERELLKVSHTLLQQIEQQRPVSAELSPHWQGVGSEQKYRGKQVNVWMVFIAISLMLVAIYVGFLANLNGKVEPVYQELESVGWQDFVEKMAETQPATLDINDVAQQIRISLSKEIDNQLVAVDVRDKMVIIRLISTSLFKSGSSFVNEDALPDVNKLVNTIREHAVSVVVVGHTDSTGKAESNWLISRKRAEAIAHWLTKANHQLRNTITRGAADTQPLFADDSESEYNRSMNRRVELILRLKG
ncbi:type IVB secretion system protein IcmH/DotU [Colwellia sp. MEBiC06753]